MRLRIICSDKPGSPSTKEAQVMLAKIFIPHGQILSNHGQGLANALDCFGREPPKRHQRLYRLTPVVPRRGAETRFRRGKMRLPARCLDCIRGASPPTAGDRRSLCGRETQLELATENAVASPTACTGRAPDFGTPCGKGRRNRLAPGRAGAAMQSESVQHADAITESAAAGLTSREGLSARILRVRAKFITYHGQRCRNPS
jgi:hypothetical protein